MKIRPRNNIIVVRVAKTEEKIGLIVLPERARKPADEGTVVSMGPGFVTKWGWNWPMPPIEPGDKIAVTPGILQTAPGIMVEGVKHAFIRSDDALAVIG